MAVHGIDMVPRLCIMRRGSSKIRVSPLMQVHDLIEEVVGRSEKPWLLLEMQVKKSRLVVRRYRGVLRKLMECSATAGSGSMVCVASTGVWTSVNSVIVESSGADSVADQVSAGNQTGQ